MRIIVDAVVKNPSVEKRVEVVITGEDIKELARQKLSAEYSDEATVHIYDCMVKEYVHF